MIYEFYFPESKVTQRLLLISHEVWKTYRAMPQDSNKQAKKAKAFLKEYTGESDHWFTDQSPLFEAITTGILDCNGKYKCQVKPINDGI